MLSNFRIESLIKGKFYETFLSYAHDDLELVREVYEGLKKRKVDVWFDKVDLVPGKWKPQIEKQIHHCTG